MPLGKLGTKFSELENFGGGGAGMARFVENA
jgi:hypothetical protein